MELLQNQSSGKKNKFRKKKTVETIFIACMLLYPMFNFAIFYIWGNLTSVVMAFQKTNTTTFESEWVGLYQFRRFINELIEQPNIWLYIKNALLYFIILLALGSFD